MDYISKEIHRFFQNNEPTKKQLHDIKMISHKMGEIPARGVHIYANKSYGNCWAVMADYKETAHNKRNYSKN